MNLLNENQPQKTNKASIERVEKVKQEAKQIGRCLRTPGLKLWAWDYQKDELYEVVPKEQRSILIKDNLKQETHIDRSASINPTHPHFEALNLKSATKRLNRFKEGKIKVLMNLRFP